MPDFDSSLPIRTENPGDVVAKIGDGTTPTQQLAIDVSGLIGAKAYDAAGTGLTSQANGGQQALDVGINVAGVQIDPRSIRALTATDVVSSNIRDATGTAFSATNPLPVAVLSNNPGTEVNDYATAAALAAAATSNHDYTVTALKTLLLTQIEAAGSGKIKVEIQVETGVGAGTYTTKFVQFNSTAAPNTSVRLTQPIQVAAGVKVRVSITNDDKQAQNVYSTISGSEV